MGLRQGSGLCSSSPRKYPLSEGCYMLQTVWDELDYHIDVCRITKDAYRAPISYVTKIWSVVVLNKKNTYTVLLSQVYCV